MKRIFSMIVNTRITLVILISITETYLISLFLVGKLLVEELLVAEKKTDF